MALQEHALHRESQLTTRLLLMAESPWEKMHSIQNDLNVVNSTRELACLMCCCWRKHFFHVSDP